MAVRTLVTRGFGNGVFAGTIPLAVRQGYYSAGEVASPDSIKDSARMRPRHTTARMAERITAARMRPRNTTGRVEDDQ